MLPNVVKETAVTMTMALINIWKNAASNALAKHRNQVCKTRHRSKFASLKLVQLAPRSFCHALDGIWEQPPKFIFSRGEFRKTSSRSAAPSATLSLEKHLEYSKEGLWGSKDGNLLPLLLQVTFASLTICNCLLHIFGFPMLPNVVKETAVTMALTFEKKTRRLTNWPNIATKFARRDTGRSLLLSNWSSWRRAASATEWMEFESNHQSSSSPGESSARLPAGLRPHRHLWCPRWSTWSAQKGTVRIKGWQSVAAPLANDFCKPDRFQLFISHVWPFNVA